MLDKHITILEDRSVDAAKVIADSQRMLSREMALISEKEIKARDRVDISLEEYNRMVKTIADLKFNYGHAVAIIEQLGIPMSVIDKIDPNSITVETSKDYIDFKQNWRITFSSDDF